MSNHKSFWTEKEENNLLHEIQLNLSLEEIAERHQRTKTAIELRFALLLEKKLILILGLIVGIFLHTLYLPPSST